MAEESPIIVRDGSLEIDSPVTPINPGMPGSLWIEGTNTLTYNSPSPLTWIKLEYDNGTSISTQGPFEPQGKPWKIEVDRNGPMNDLILTPAPGGVAGVVLNSPRTPYGSWVRGKHVWKSRGGPPINTVRIEIDGTPVPGSPFTMAPGSKGTAIRLLFTGGPTAV